MFKYDLQSKFGTVVAHIDSDWVGCRQVGKSTSDGLTAIGGHLIKSFSRQQKSVVLSSARVELHAIVAASAGTLCIIGLCKDIGFHLGGGLHRQQRRAWHGAKIGQ